MTNAVCCVEVSVSMRGRVFVCIGMGGCVDHACVYHYELSFAFLFADFGMGLQLGLIVCACSKF